MLTENNVSPVAPLLGRLGSAPTWRNGAEAIKASSATYDVILMDVQIPEMDGVSATRFNCENWLTEQRPYIIAMTANALPGRKVPGVGWTITQAG